MVSGPKLLQNPKGRSHHNQRPWRTGICPNTWVVSRLCQRLGHCANIFLFCFLNKRGLQTNLGKLCGSARLIQRERECGNGWTGLTYRKGSSNFTLAFFFLIISYCITALCFLSYSQFWYKRSGPISATGNHRSRMVEERKIVLNSRNTILWGAGTMKAAKIPATGSVRRNSLHNTGITD